MLAAKLMSRAYTNGRHPGRVEFLTLATVKLANVVLRNLNTIKNIIL